MSSANYAHCEGCERKAFYTGEEDIPEGVVIWHETCLAARDHAAVTVSRADIRAVVRLARMSRHLAEDPATDRLAEAAGPEGEAP
jgi:hypothetical protein